MKSYLLFFLLFSSFYSSAQDGLAVHYPFSGSAEDISGNEVPTLIFGATLTENRFGQEDEAYLLDGEDDYIFIDANDIGPVTDMPFSISIWVKKNEASTGWSNTFSACQWGQGSVTQGSNQWSFSLSQSGDDDTPSFAYEIGTTRNALYANQEMEIGEWTFLLAQYDGELLTFYVNGELQDTHNIGNQGINVVGRDLKFGTNDIGTSIIHSEIEIDDFRLYRRLLNDQQIIDLFNFAPLVPTKKVSNNSSIKLFPNPTSIYLNIELEKLESVEEIVIFNAAGQIVYEGTYAPSIDVQSFSQGLHYVLLYSENRKKQSVQKFIKLGPPQA